MNLMTPKPVPRKRIERRPRRERVYGVRDRFALSNSATTLDAGSEVGRCRKGGERYR